MMKWPDTTWKRKHVLFTNRWIIGQTLPYKCWVLCLWKYPNIKINCSLLSCLLESLSLCKYRSPQLGKC